MTNKLTSAFWYFFLIFFTACVTEPNNEREKPAKEQVSHHFIALHEIQALPVINQHASGTCWSFSTASFLESEIIRLKGEEIDLSEMYFVRNAYIFKTRNYIMRQGTARFTEGGLSHDPIITMKEFGLVPLSAYPGLIRGNTVHDHREMFEKLESTVKEYANPSKKPGTGWKSAVPAIMDNYMGEVPAEFEYKGKTYTPAGFLTYTGINPDDYLTITSFSHTPYYEPFILNIPANWANERFYNLPLEEFMQNIDHAIEKGFSLALDIDASERGFHVDQGIAVLPEANGNAGSTLAQLRQEEFENFYTTDDHLMHIVGKVKDQNGNTYYKTKNSWGPAAGREGFMYLSIPYLQMKAISVLLHKDGLSDSTLYRLGLTKQQ